MHHATVDGNTTLGADNEIHPCLYWWKNHDLKYQGGIHRLRLVTIMYFVNMQRFIVPPLKIY